MTAPGNGKATPKRVQQRKYKTLEEGWNEYVMDNIRVRMKFVTTAMGRELGPDGKPMFNDDGSPVVSLSGQLIVNASTISEEEDE